MSVTGEDGTNIPKFDMISSAGMDLSLSKSCHVSKDVRDIVMDHAFKRQGCVIDWMLI